MTDAALLDVALKIAEILAIIGGGAIFLISFGRTASRLEIRLDTQGNDITDLKNDIKALNAVVTVTARQDEKMNAMGERLNILDKRLYELSHGRGIVTE